MCLWQEFGVCACAEEQYSGRLGSCARESVQIANVCSSSKYTRIVLQGTRCYFFGSFPVLFCGVILTVLIHGIGKSDAILCFLAHGARRCLSCFVLLW